MQHTSRVIDSDSLRAHLTAPDPMRRVMGLHALETAAERSASNARSALGQEAARFAARGIPYYALHDPHFQAWVGKAATYWERLHAARK